MLIWMILIAFASIGVTALLAGVLWRLNAPPPEAGAPAPDLPATEHTDSRS